MLRKILVQWVHVKKYGKPVIFTTKDNTPLVTEENGVLKVLWYGEADFKLSGAINWQNCIYLEYDNPYETIEKLHNQCL